jgi:hypothetical protein
MVTSGAMWILNWRSQVMDTAQHLRLVARLAGQRDEAASDSSLAKPLFDDTDAVVRDKPGPGSQDQQRQKQYNRAPCDQD